MNDNDVSSRLDSEILQEVRSGLPQSRSTFPATNSNEPYEFLSKLKKYCKQRFNLGHFGKCGHSAFLFIPLEKQDLFSAKGLEPSSWRLTAKHSTDLHKKVFLVFDTNFNRYKTLDIVCDDNDGDQIHDLICQKISDLEQIANGPICHALLDQDALILSEFICGTDSEPVLFELDKDFEVFSRQDLEKFAEELHERSTKLPTGAVRIWDNQTKLNLSSHPEDRIVRNFVQLLENRVGLDNVEYESTTQSGRQDLVIHNPAMVDGQGPCVLEFKVIQPRDSSLRAGRWLSKGVLQARDYSKDLDAQSRYLMAYDARTTPQPLECVRRLAKKYDVIYKRFRIYSSTSQQREEELAHLEKHFSKK